MRVHTVEVTSANVHNVTVAAKVLREDDEAVYGDSAYPGLEKCDETKRNPQLSSIKFHINRWLGRLPRASDRPLTGNAALRTANPLYDAKWNTLTES